MNRTLLVLRNALLVTGALGASRLPAASATNTATAKPLGPPLPDAVIDVYVPPTRAESPYAATARRVFRLDQNSGQWRRLYEVPWRDTHLLGIAGYAKSSQVLYLAHTRGGARTRDAGATWQEFAPLGFAGEKGRFIGLAVNPTNRHEAILAFEKKAWVSLDYGKTFDPLSLPTPFGTLVGVGYAAIPATRLVVLTTKGLYMKSAWAAPWQRLPGAVSNPRHLVLSPHSELALVVGSHAVVAYDLAHPGHYEPVPVALEDSPVQPALDCAARGVVWSVQDRQIIQRDLKQAKPVATTIYTASQPVTCLASHPREMDTLIWAAGPRVWIQRGLFAGRDPRLSVQMDLAVFQSGPVEAVSAAGQALAAHARHKAMELLDRIMKNQPALDLIIAKVLHHAGYKPGEVQSWKRQVNKRNWLPQVRLGGGMRDLALDRNRTIYETDRFGVVSANDLRQNDVLEPAPYVGLTLVWNLDKLLYDPEQVKINREKRYQIKQRNDLITEVTHAYYERLQVLLKLEQYANTLSESDKLANLVKLREYTDLINGLCGEPILSPEAP